MIPKVSNIESLGETVKKLLINLYNLSKSLFNYLLSSSSKNKYFFIILLNFDYYN